ncbi:MAG: AMP-dependent synthetase and ligase [Nocardioides sp.]|jgi:acyl-coenzyme A synthetase/AMP-(fatty) acid ligase|uniref:AMP-binding protein n=1 Tax=Nocardioides sp. TaxID=35761 RepID=UPI00260E406D|nr:AMP-binding protein [Nocardioides sp.]MCW2833887.1 AMP-dependent synthetase and ligase [Nocardioides sp.]
MTMVPDSVHQLLPFAGAAEDVALVQDGRSLTYAGLAAAIRHEADRLTLLGPRRVRVLEMRNDIDSVVALLGSLTAGHPVVVVEAGNPTRSADIEAAYAGASDLHPDLGLLLSTSASTGSPKLVRLSHDNIWANAQSIADYLGLTAEDRAVMSLPLHYCYGLSVLTSHLVVGATVVLTDASVADDRFWSLARSAGATSFAGVPYTFELLECRGFTGAELPTLRYLTQAGGRMDPARVRRFAALGRERAFDLFVMYGQTEATARMAYLPPHLAHDRPEAIGIPVPGGDFRLAPVPGAPDGAGELVYTGPNVMMGYAHTAADLARGPETTTLHTGDLARQADDGLWEICGRLDRHAKVLGLRLDLARLEARMPVATAVVVDADAVHAFVTASRMTERVRRELSALSGLPGHLVRVHEIETLPTNSRGKTDYALLAAHASASATATLDDQHEQTMESASPEALRNLFAVVLGRPDADLDHTFADLGGDSLSFVEVSTQLAHRLGHLPAGWPRLTPRQLAATARPGSRRLLATEPAVVLRALAIVAIVMSHADLFMVMGGAHVLLAVVGFNLARLSLHTVGRTERARRLVASTAGFAVPAAVWIGVTGTVTGDYRPATALFLNQAVGGPTWTADWQFWFLEVVVWSTLGLAALVLLPVLDRGLRQRPFAVAVGVLGCALAVRYLAVGLAAGGTDKYTLLGTVWCIAIGWAAAEARTRRQRYLVAAAIVVGAAGYFSDDLSRTAVLVAGMLVLLAPGNVRLPRHLSRSLHLVAGASLWIYLTHWQVYPGLEAAGHPVAAVLTSIAVGLLAHRAHGWVLSRLRPR